MSQPRVDIISKHDGGPYELFRIYQDGESKVPTVTVHMDGSVTYGPDANPNEAADIFWRVLVQSTEFQTVLEIVRRVREAQGL